MFRELTDKQKLAIKNRVSGMNKKASALNAGYSETVANNAEASIFGSPNVRKALIKEMKKAGIDDIKLGKILKEGLDSTSLYGKKSTKHADYRTRLEYVKYINEVRGLDIKKSVDVTSGGEAIKIGLFSGGLPDVPDQPEAE